MTIPCFSNLLRRQLCHQSAPKLAVAYQQKAWQLNEFSNDFASLLLAECSRHVQRADEVLVRVHAASINPIDLEVASGFGHNLFNVMRFVKRYDNWDPFPLCLGRDFSGVIEAKGTAVTKFNVGDEVIGVLHPEVSDGSHATHVTASSKLLVLKPKDLSHEEATAVPYAGLTALSAISIYAGLNSSNSRFKRVMVVGGTGSVGISAIAILKSFGADVTATCASNAKEWLKNVTAVDDVIDYENPSESESHFGKYDLVLNVAPISRGSIHSNVLNYLKRKSGAQYVTLTSPILDNIDKRGVILGSLSSIGDIMCQNVTHLLNEGIFIKWAFVVPSQGGLEFLANLTKENNFQPVLDRVFPFDQTPDAYRYVAKGHARGKTVIKMSEE